MSKLTRRGFLAASMSTLLTLAACKGKEPTATQDATADGTDDEAATRHYAYRYADIEEGAYLILGNEEYLRGFNQCDLEFRLQKKGATLEEWEELAVRQVEEFSDDEMQALDAAMAEIESLIVQRGIALPESEEIVFVKTTMEEEGGASAYTHGTQIYLRSSVMSLLMADDEKYHKMGVGILVHELFHCLTRSNPDFRTQMYKIISFDVQEGDYAFGPNVAERIISNPDVEHHNSSALFTIDGEQRRCAVVFYAKKFFETKGDNFFDFGGTGLVPIDDLNTLYDSEEASDFWEVFGRNTDYVIDPEETMADNFAFAITYGRDGRKYKTPQIIDAILTGLSA